MGFVEKGCKLGGRRLQACRVVVACVGCCGGSSLGMHPVEQGNEQVVRGEGGELRRRRRRRKPRVQQFSLHRISWSYGGKTTVGHFVLLSPLCLSCRISLSVERERDERFQVFLRVVRKMGSNQSSSGDHSVSLRELKFLATNEIIKEKRAERP